MKKQIRTVVEVDPNSEWAKRIAACPHINRNHIAAGVCICEDCRAVL